MAKKGAKLSWAGVRPRKLLSNGVGLIIIWTRDLKAIHET